MVSLSGVQPGTHWHEPELIDTSFASFRRRRHRSTRDDVISADVTTPGSVATLVSVVTICLLTIIVCGAGRANIWMRQLRDAGAGR